METTEETALPLVQGSGARAAFALRPEFLEQPPSEQVVAEPEDLMAAVPSAGTMEGPTRDLETFWTRLDYVFRKLQQERPVPEPIQDILDQMPSTMNLNQRKFQSVLYQPDRISLNSQDDVNAQNETPIGFSRFRCRFLRPVLQVKSCQILRASIPTPVTNIPDTAIVWWYYKLPANPAYNNALPYSALNLPFLAPKPQYLRFIRLTASTAPPEQVIPTYAQNRYFSDYQDLVNELNIACGSEPLNAAGLLPLYPNGPTWEQNDVRFEFDGQNNKITFQGLNAGPGPNPTFFYLPASYNDNLIFERLDYDTWNFQVAYSVGDIVKYRGENYICINQPFPSWVVNTAYAQGTKVAYNRRIFIARNAIASSQFPPPTDLTNWAFSATNDTPLFSADWSYYEPAANLLQLVLGSEQNIFGYTESISTTYQTPVIIGQTLNLRLGFTWNGSFEGWADYVNQARPLVQNQGETPTYSSFRFGNTYPNLVNTGCVYVYADFINGSTQDSAGNSGLLCCVPLNTANNAVAFFQATINTPLLKLPANLTEMEIRMLDDNGSPFFLPDSAVVNLELQFTYE